MRHDELLNDFLAALAALGPAQWCQAFFLFAASGVAAVAVMPRDAKALLMDYGARKARDRRQPPADDKSDSGSGSGSARGPSPGWLLSLLAAATSCSQVPHSWFGAFYAVSLACSGFWLVQFLGGGAVLRLVASSQAARAPGSSPTMGQVALGWLMMSLQAARRVYEHAVVLKPSKSTMWVVHWLLGLLFYLAMSVAVWVEGSGPILDPEASHAVDAESLVKLVVGTPAFLFAWANQYRCHKHLAGLKKYSLPQEGMFRNYICPHYTCECLLYLSLAVTTAPRGSWCNRTVLCAVVFVAVNLGVTASGTRKWYADKFGIGSVANKWNMIPLIF
ncbi:hypothetical protein VTK26DRAFT_4601 [Humicola hyalothermophila]